VLVTLEAKDTRALVLASSRPVEVVDHLLAAVLVAFAEWTGRPELLLDLEGHGRVDLAPEIDVSRTVGWFTALYPVRLEVRSTPPETLQAVREHLRRVPAGGVGYGLLRHGGREDLARQLRGCAQAEVLFNYLGGAAASSQDMLRLAPESTGPARATGNRRHRIEINAAIVGGALQVAWSAEGLRAATLEALAGRFASALRLLVPDRPGDAASAELEAAIRQVRFD
jgi:non-ribosomal peptide synthase protein (TIGR01720 family)